jgi:hypothetical protein
LQVIAKAIRKKLLLPGASADRAQAL